MSELNEEFQEYKENLDHVLAEFNELNDLEKELNKENFELLNTHRALYNQEGLTDEEIEDLLDGTDELLDSIIDLDDLSFDEILEQEQLSTEDLIKCIKEEHPKVEEETLATIENILDKMNQIYELGQENEEFFEQLAEEDIEKFTNLTEEFLETTEQLAEYEDSYKEVFNRIDHELTALYFRLASENEVMSTKE